MRRVAVAAALLASACASGVPVERQTVVSGSRFDAVQGEAAFVVRTFLPKFGTTSRDGVTSAAV